MNIQVSPTKGNLLSARKSLQLSKLGYDLMDRKRNVLIREMMSLMVDVRRIQSEIMQTYADAYYALQQANIAQGVIAEVAKATTIETGVTVVYRSVMGVEIPKVRLKERPITLEYPLEVSNSRLDEAYILLRKTVALTVELAMIDNSVFRLAKAIQKTQKRANALKNIVIPRYEAEIRFIAAALEEKEREEFTRMKVIKRRKNTERSESS